MAKKELSIKLLREHHSKHEYIQDENGDFLLDMVSINLILTVYDAMKNEESKKNFEKALNTNLVGLVNRCWKVCS